MTLNDLLDVAGCVVNVKYGDHYVEHVTEDNPLISKVIFQKIVKSVEAGLDTYECGTLEVEIE